MRRERTRNSLVARPPVCPKLGEHDPGHDKDPDPQGGESEGAAPSPSLLGRDTAPGADSFERLFVAFGLVPWHPLFDPLLRADLLRFSLGLIPLLPAVDLFRPFLSSEETRGR